LPFAGTSFLADRRIERHVTAQTAVHLDDVLFGHAEPPGNDLALVGSQIALLNPSFLTERIGALGRHFRV
jgi:hypothetical protein